MESLTFKDLIDEALKINDLSINKLATIIGVDRPWLQHALVGRRNLGYDNFEKIMANLNLPEHLISSIRIAFANEYFGETNFSIMEHMQTVLNEMTIREQTPPQDNIENLIDLINLSTFNDAKIKFLNAINDLLQAELKNKKPVIYTTYAFDIECIRMIFLHILRSSNKVIDYKHLIFREPDNSETEIVDSFLYQFEFAGYGYNTYTSQSRKGVACSPLPYFIMTSEAVIFFSHNLELFVLDKSPTTVSYINTYFQKNLASSLPFSYVMNNAEASTLFPSLLPNNTNNANEQPQYCYDLSPNLCLATYLTADILAESVPDWFEHKDFFIYGVEGFFDMYRTTPHSAVWHIDSLMNFAENDEEFCDYHNVTFDVLKLSPKSKYQLLCKLRDYAYKNTIRHFIMNNKQCLPSYFHVNCYNNSLVLGFNFRIFNIEEERAYIATAVSQDPIIHKHLRNFAEYFEHSTFVYSASPEYAITQINNAIAYYKNKHNF